MRSLLLALSAMVLPGLFTPVAQGSSQPVTVLLQFDHPGSQLSSRTMEREVRNLLGPGIDLRFKILEKRDQSEPGRLVVFRLHGFCSMNGPEIAGRAGVALGSTYVSDGAVLPFGQIECDRLRASVQRALGTRNAAQHERQLGVAMGRVLAHELYHMLAGSKEHTLGGVTKAGLSPAELVRSDAAISAKASAAMDPALNSAAGR